MSDGTVRTTTAAFSVTTPSTTAKLDANRKAQVAFTVTNATIQPLKGRARVVAMDGAKPEWFAIDGDAERAFASSGTQQYTVQVNVPATAPAGKYTFQLKVVGVTNPDEQYGESQQVAFEVPQPPKPSTPLPIWIWIVAAIVALLILGGIALGLFLANRKPVASFNTASVDFGNQVVGTPSASKSLVTVTSTGPVDLHVKSVSVSGANAGDFQLADGCSSNPVASGKGCSVYIAFKPVAAGLRTGNLVFTMDTESGSKSIALTGQGQPAQPQISLKPIPLALRFGSRGGLFYSGTLRVTNTGTADLHVTSVQVDRPTFSFNNGCANIPIAPQGYCDIEVTAPPTLSLLGNLIIYDDVGQQIVPIIPG